MLDTSFVLWLQEWASPALTEIMRAVSFWGYVPSCLAVAIVCGFGWRLRLGVTLILAIVFADAMTIVAKGTFASPRPHAVDARVRTLGAFESGLSPTATGTSVPADHFGFPSGHVATTAAWALGLAWVRRKPWQLGAAGTWIALMALSRMYLGRHFPADVLGGLVVGVAALDDSVPPATRMARMAVALVLLGVALWSSTWTIATGPGLAVMNTMAVSAALHASALLVPALALGGHRS